MNDIVGYQPGTLIGTVFKVNICLGIVHDDLRANGLHTQQVTYLGAEVCPDICLRWKNY